MNKSIRIILLYILSNSMLIFGNDVKDPFVKLIAIRKQMKSDEKIYREACYKEYIRGNGYLPRQVPSAAELDEEPLKQLCLQHLRTIKTHSKKIMKKRVKMALVGMGLGALIPAIPFGFSVALEGGAGFCGVLAGSVYAGAMGGILALAFGDAEGAVLEKELLKREQQAMVKELV